MKVVEKFVSINGEGTRAGELAVFVRFLGCNLHCGFCDTKWATLPDCPYEEMTPGPVGLNCATYIGQQQCGIAGALAASLGVLTPSLVLGVLIAVFLKRFKDNRIVAMLLEGIRPAALGMIAAAVVFFAETSLFTAPLAALWTAGHSFGLSWQGVLIFAVVLAMQSRWKLPLPVVLAAAAAAGALLW